MIQHRVTQAVGIQFEYRPPPVQSALKGGSIQRTVISLYQASERMRTVASGAKIVQDCVSRPIGAQLEDRSRAKRSESSPIFGCAIEQSVASLQQRRGR